VKIVTVANQKGGVGKTTTAINLASAIAMLGTKTLLIDMDPQANVTSGLGIPKASLEMSVYAALIGNKPIRDILVPTAIPNLFLAPSGIDLVGAELELASIENRENRLKEALKAIDSDFQFAIIDCPPSLGLVTLNALNAAHSVLIPIQCEYYALEGLSLLMNTVEFVRQKFNPGLEIEGIVCTMYDGRSNLTRQVQDEVTRHFGNKLYRTIIPRNIRLAEAPGFGKPGVTYDPTSVGARAYKILAEEFLQNNNIRVSQIGLEPAVPAGVS
jgi:chromosome partitioning protein